MPVCPTNRREMNAFCLFAIAISLTGISAQSGPTITTPSGQIQGTVESCGLFCTYYSFKGIPYAQPPVGNLRFRNPVSHPGWSGVRDAAQHGSFCPQYELLTLEVIGDEDCLYLNVYSPELIGQRPVMVWMHGGAYSSGSGDSDVYDPQKLIREGVVVVTINYRLGALGFLSTNDEHAQGNWGLKDCIEALRWVQRNIAAYGGDPDNVTIFGNSAGGSLVHFLYLSDMANGLFHKAIAQSGTALAPFAFQTNPKFYADRFANIFGLSSDSAVYVDQLRTLPASSFIPFQEALLTIPVPRFMRPLDFAPSTEPASSPESRALTTDPMSLMRSRQHTVPFLMGYNDLEGSFFTTVEFAVDQTVFDQFNNNPDLFVPFFWNINTGSPASSAVSSAFQQHYFNNQQLGLPLFFEWSKYYGDHLFLFPVHYTAQVHAQSLAPVYYYQFSYDGDLNLFKKSLGITLPGAIHVDEIPYLFELAEEMGAEVPPGSHAITVSDRMVRMWANFAKYSDPTPSSDSLLQNLVWPTIQESSNGVAMMDIGQNLMVTDASTSETFVLWHRLQDQYATNPFL
ncbi:carboxylesterase 5A [Aedes albopictus]|uniref:Carboxylesterase type B domain-containing protein n=1 Tax=Aedes albopictus TaxID=7160 RepID=A0ABM1XJA9_AEDAL